MKQRRRSMKKAYLYENLDKKRVRCRLCGHGCQIKEGSKGVCGVRENRDGDLLSLVYGKVIAMNVDPVEKKPLFHFLPGTRAFSIATVGCNFHCSFCQNSDISQMPVDHNRILGDDVRPEEVVKNAKASRSASIAYTYTEPTVYYEFALDTARLAAAEGLKNIFVSNGYMTEECLKEIHTYLHGINIDLKAFSKRFYRDYCGARLTPVLDSIKKAKELGIWVEVTTLLIPGMNDSDGELEDIAGFLAGVDPDIPWHISRFHPTYRLTDIGYTPAEDIHRARDIGYNSGLKYVYTGNLPGDDGEKTFCPGCGKLLIERDGYFIRNNAISKGLCPKCNERIPGVWM
jgi:pyruvate formate lyase activating enzyme